MTIIVTGGAGFIGSNFILGWLATENAEMLVNLDKLTYAGNPENLKDIKTSAAYRFIHGDIGDGALVRALLQEFRPRAILNFAAESHVDRSILGPSDFIQTNVVATFNLLESVRAYWEDLPAAEQQSFRLVQVSTDEVYGSLGEQEAPFTEKSGFAPNSPYSASKAAADHLVRACYHTYGVPVLTTRCSNNYGPRQFPEKLIPLMIYRALHGETLPLYGDGQNIRDWLYVTDHCAAIREVLARGAIGETYNIGGWNEKTNLEVVEKICDILDGRCPRGDGLSYRAQIGFVKDRPGHDRRYAIDAGRIYRELGWRPVETFESGILKAVEWYLSNPDWVAHITSGAYREWVGKQYSS